MFEKIFWFGAGYLVARYIILHNPDYTTKEAAYVDKLRNDVHDLIKKFAPTADDLAVQEQVVNTVK
jgi:hypothetical protein